MDYWVDNEDVLKRCYSHNIVTNPFMSTLYEHLVTPVSIDRESKLPLYYQLTELLLESIRRGDWEAGDMLPTELQLQEKYDLSRTTVRQALRELELEGLVTRYRGRGTFVAEPKVTHNPRLSLSNYLEQVGMTPGWKVIDAEWVSAPSEVAERLAIPPETEAFRLRRLRLADGDPIGYHVAFVSPEFSDAIDLESLDQGGSLRYLRKGNVLSDSLADRFLEAVGASEEEAQHLGVEPGDPLLLIRRLVVSRDERQIEDFRGVYRGDRFQYQISNLPSVQPLHG